MFHYYLFRYLSLKLSEIENVEIVYEKNIIDNNRILIIHL